MYFSAPQFGYANVLEYYNDAVVSNRVNQFSIPVFGLNAIDDPLQPGESEFNSHLHSIIYSLIHYISKNKQPDIT